MVFNAVYEEEDDGREPPSWLLQKHTDMGKQGLGWGTGTGTGTGGTPPD